VNAADRPRRAEPHDDTLAYVAAALDDVRAALDAAQSAASTALACVRIQQMRDGGEATPR
jgi:hypothetical protein